MLVCVDHGNKLIKSKNVSFISGLSEFEHKPPFGGNIMEFNNKFYSLSNKRIYYMKDKTEDDNYFILTLFAIAFEIENRGAYSRKCIDIKLVVGLPPSHYGALHDKFENYFLGRETLKFIFNNKQYEIKINSIDSFPQSYAAVISRYNEVKNIHRAIILDIGGYTADYLIIRNGIPDLDFCESLDNGIAILYNNIIKRANSEVSLKLEENDIDDIIKGNFRNFSTEVVNIVKSETKKFVDNLLGDLGERKLNISQDKLVVVGGGGILLKKYFQECSLVSEIMVIDDIYANAKGYEILHNLSNKGEAYE